MVYWSFTFVIINLSVHTFVRYLKWTMTALSLKADSCFLHGTGEGGQSNATLRTSAKLHPLIIFLLGFPLH